MTSDDDVLDFSRQYFEGGCLCLLSGIIDKVGEGLSDIEACETYSKSCTCSRNPESPKSPWDEKVPPAVIKNIVKQVIGCGEINQETKDLLREYYENSRR